MAVMDLPLRASLDEIFSQWVLAGSYGGSDLPRKTLFEGEGVGEISSYVAGWMAVQGIDVVVLDGANRFNPYTVSSLARKVLISPEGLLKRIRIARAFTCYQMTTLIERGLDSLLSTRTVGAIHESPLSKPWVILLGPITTFLDEDVPEREVGLLFERTLRKVEALTEEGIPFFLFQPSPFPKHRLPSLTRGGRRRPEPDDGARWAGGFMGSKRAYLMRRLVQFSNLVLEICLDDQGSKIVLKKGMGLNIIENCKLQNGKCRLERKDLPRLSGDRKILQFSI